MYIMYFNEIHFKTIGTDFKIKRIDDEEVKITVKDDPQNQIKISIDYDVNNKEYLISMRTERKIDGKLPATRFRVTKPPKLVSVVSNITSDQIKSK